MPDERRGDAKDTSTFLDATTQIRRPRAEPEDGDPVIAEGEKVPVARDHDHLPGVPRRQCGENVVGLVPRTLEDGNPCCTKGFPSQIHLVTQILGTRRPLPLVAGVDGASVAAVVGTVGRRDEVVDQLAARDASDGSHRTLDGLERTPVVEAHRNGVRIPGTGDHVREIDGEECGHSGLHE
jgi:hypothetical protein